MKQIFRKIVSLISSIVGIHPMLGEGEVSCGGRVVKNNKKLIGIYNVG